MAGYKKHLWFGWITHFFTSIIIILISYPIGISMYMITSIVGITLPITLLASIIPDIDHHSSNSNEMFRYFLFIISISSSVILLSKNRDKIETILQNQFQEFLTPYISMLLIILFSLTVGYVSVLVFRKIRPSHRGFMHGLSFGIIISILISLVSFQVHESSISTGSSEVVAILFFLYTISGILSHIIVDNRISIS